MADLYKILGVDTQADPDQIKKAYRKLARELHPDVNADPQAQERFKQVNEAYETLSDSQKRAEYDHMQQHGAAPGGFRFHQSSGGFQDIFEQMFGNMGFSPFQQRPAKNPDNVYQLNITLEDAFRGKQVQINLADTNQPTNQIQVNIPPGVEDGMRIRYAGNGNRVQSNLPPGDLVIIIHVEPHTTWQRQGPHLHQELQVPLWQALLGDQLTVHTIDGGQVKVKLPELSVNQTVLKVAQKGMKIRNNVQRGDLYLHVKVIMPTQLTPEQQEHIGAWRDLS
jgi:DnaJ-class molecular chaperone